MQLHGVSLCPVAGHQEEEINTPLSAAPLKEVVDSRMKPPLILLFLQLNKSSDLSCSSSVFSSRPFTIFIGLFWAYSTTAHSKTVWFLLILRHPSLHTVLEVRLYRGRVGWENHLPQLATSALLDVLQDTVSPLGCRDTLLTRIQLAINPNAQISFRGATVQPFVPQCVRATRITPFQAENAALALVKFHMVGDCHTVCKLA